MAYPSWLTAWPANWPDFVAQYVEMVPRFWPKRMFKRGKKVFADLQAIGEGLSAPRRLLEFALRGFLPPADVFGLFLHYWEDDFDVTPEATIALRQSRLAMRARLLNQSCADDIVRAVFSEVFSCNPDELGIAHAAPATVAAVQTLGNVTHARWHNSYHVYKLTEDVAPDLKLGSMAVAELEPAVGRITYGQWRGGTYRNGAKYRRCVYKRT